MCYSKEVSLISGITISGFSAYCWNTFLKNQGKKISKRLEKFTPFIRETIFAYLCIAGHQFFEFFAILTGSQFLYKTGLAVSMTFNFFIIRALEKITNRSFGSKFVSIVIISVWLEMLGRQMEFSNHHFWVRGYHHLPWGAVWLFLWFYFLSANIFIALKSKSKLNKLLLVLNALLINFTFFLSVAYSYLSTIFKFEKISDNCVLDIFCSFDLINDFASIWCVFAVLQGPFFILILSLITKKYDTSKGFSVDKITWLHKLSFALSSFSILLILYKYVPIVFGVAWKMVSF